MINTGLLDEYSNNNDKDSLKDEHIKRIQEYIKAFPSFDKHEEITKESEGVEHNFLDPEKVKHLDSNLDNMDTQIRSMLVKHSSDSGKS